MDHGTFKELNPDLAPNDVLHFPDYQEKLAAASVKTGLKEAAVTATGMIGGVQAVVAVLDSRFFMGSMSTAVGEKITRAIEYAAAKKLPLVIFSASGGARMQEGIFSLMQMAKTSAAIERFSAKGGLYISVLTTSASKLSYVDLTADIFWPISIGQISAAPVALYSALQNAAADNAAALAPWAERQTGMQALEPAAAETLTCLLYTSPSPRD